jgi:hypothetical protein
MFTLAAILVAVLIKPASRTAAAVAREPEPVPA